MQELSRLDRRLGDALRRFVAASPGGLGAAGLVAAVMSPAFRLAVAVMIVRRRTRGTGVRCLAAGVAAGVAARLLRDHLGRPRPGRRDEGGFPSRHAAAAAAIATAASPGEPRIARLLAGAAAVGLAARVAAAEHDPADIAAGAALGLVGGRAVGIVAAAATRGARRGCAS